MTAGDGLGDVIRLAPIDAYHHGGALRLDVECLECELTDLGGDDLGASDLDAESSGLGAE